MTAETITCSLETPSVDDRDYRDIRLSNGLECLLVHDAGTDKASAALDVNVGSFSDEDDMPGMAHAVEHFLFMGTKKYPSENDYKQYLSFHSGHSNAFTSDTSTNFYFEVDAKPDNDECSPDTRPSPFYGALDRFAQFFIDPLFLASTLDRELCAIDAENKKNLQSDQWRLSQLEKSLSNHKHPYYHFDVGNLEVLKTEPEAKGINVRQKFMEFYRRHYSANRMKLCVLGRESLDVLQKWVEELFGAVPNKDLPQNRWEDDVPFGKEQLTMQCFARPVMELRELDISFPFLDEEHMYETQPGWYISHLIGHEGPGSIMSYIKMKGWAISLTAGTYPICPSTPGIFRCSVRLTKEGLTHYKEIVNVFFQYVSLLKETRPQEWIFDELKVMADVEFKFKQKTSASHFTSTISSAMQGPLPREWLLSGRIPRKFDPKLIRQGLDCLRPDNFWMIVISQVFPGEWDQKEKWYGTEYKLERIPTAFLAELAKAAETTVKDRLTALHLPYKNKFIPTKLEVERKEAKEPPTEPRLVRNDECARIWHKKDDTFWVPEVNFRAMCKSPTPLTSAENWLKTWLYTDLVRDVLEEYSYDADIAGLQYTFAADPQGLFIEVAGYNDKLSDLLEKVLQTIRDLEIRGDRFEIIKERLDRGLRNSELSQPYTHISSYMTWLTAEKKYSDDELHIELPGITADTIRQFHKQLVSHMYIETYVHGNLHKGDALNLTAMIENILQPRKLPQDQVPIIRSLVLPAGSNYLYKRTLKDPENVNHCIGYYLYIGSRGDGMMKVKGQLLDQVLDEPAFDQLRTKEQLGYVVQSGLQTCATTYWFYFIIQSEKTPIYLESRIDAFLAQQAAALENMSDVDFENHKRSTIAKRLEKPKNLYQETGRHWSCISNGYYDFGAAQVDADHISQLTKSDIIEFYSTYILPTSLRRAKLAVHLVAQKPSTAFNDVADETGIQAVATNGIKPTLITDVRDFKSGLTASTGDRPFKELCEFQDGP